MLRRGSSFQEDRRPGSGSQTPAVVLAADRAASLPSEPQAPASQSTDDTRSEVSVDTAQQRLNSQLGSSSQAPSSPAGSARMYPPEEEAAAQPPASALLPHRLPSFPLVSAHVITQGISCCDTVRRSNRRRAAG